MKKITTFIIIIIVFSACNVISKSKITKITIGHEKINIPAPDNYISIGEDNFQRIQKNFAISNNISCIFLDSSNYNRILKNEEIILQKHPLSAILVSKKNEFREYTDYIFKNIINHEKHDMKQKIIQIFDNEKPNMKDINNFVDTTAIQGMIPLYILNDNENYFSVLNFQLQNCNMKDIKYLYIITDLRIKNKMIGALIMTVYENSESINKIKQISESWTNKIIETNR